MVHPALKGCGTAGMVKWFYTCVAVTVAMSQNFAIERCEAFSIQRLMVPSVKIVFSTSAWWPLYAVLVWSAKRKTQ